MDVFTVRMDGNQYHQHQQQEQAPPYDNSNISKAALAKKNNRLSQSPSSSPPHIISQQLPRQQYDGIYICFKIVISFKDENNYLIQLLQISS